MKYQRGVSNINKAYNESENGVIIINEIFERKSIYNVLIYQSSNEEEEEEERNNEENERK